MAGSVAQAFEHVDTASGTTSVVAATFTGNGVIACATNDASAASTISCADPTNGTYTPLDDILDTTDQQRFATFGKANSTATGAVNVTFTWTVANVFKAGCVVDCTGVAGSLDQHTGAYQHLPTTTANTQLSGTTATLNSIAASGALVVGLGFASGGAAPPAQGTTGGTWSAPVAGSATFWSFGGGLTLRVEWQRVAATTGVQAVFTSAANIDAITAVTVIDEVAGAAAVTGSSTSLPAFRLVGPGRFRAGPRLRSLSFAPQPPPTGSISGTTSITFAGALTTGGTAALTGTTAISFAANVTMPVTSRYPISIVGRKMFDAQGKPFFIKGRTAWAIMGLGATDRDAFLDDCVARGFNTIECQIPTRAPEMNLRPTDSAGNFPFLKTLGGATWTGTLAWSGNSNAPDFNTPNPAYWASVDALMAACYARNIMVTPFFAYLGQGGGSTAEGWLDEFNAIEAVSGTAGLQSYGAFVGDRFKTWPNIIYGTAGDTASGFDAEFYTTTGIQSVSSQASGPQFTSQRAGGQISTDGSGALGTSTTINGAYDWATVITQCQRAYSASATIPGFMIEEPYEDEGTAGTQDNPTFSNTPPAMRRYEWWGWLNAIGGYVAGNGYVWRFALTGTPPLTDDYRNHLNTQNTQDLTRLNAFMEYWPNTNDLIPGGLGGMRTLVVSGAGTIDTTNFNCAAQTSTGDLLIAYISPSGSTTIGVDLRSMAARRIKARWWDPTNNTYTTNGSAAGTFTLSNTASSQSFTTPGSNSAGEADWLLILEADLSYAPSGLHPFNVIGPGRFRTSGPKARSLRFAVPPGNTTLSGTTTISISTGTGTLTGAGALAATTTITGAATGAITGAGTLAGTTTLTVNETGAITGAGTLAGTSAIVVNETGAVTGAGALTATSAITFGQTGAVVAAGTLAGTSAIVFNQTGAVTGKGTLAGTSAVAFNQTGAMTGAGALAATSAIVFSQTGAILASGVLAGTSAVVFNETGAITGSGTLAGTSAITFGSSTTIAASGTLAGSTAIVFSASGAFTLVGTTAIVFSATSTLLGAGVLAGTSAAAFGSSTTIGASGTLAGTTTATFAASSTLTGSGSLAGTSPVVFNETGTMKGAGVLTGTTTATFGGSATADGGSTSGSTTISFGAAATIKGGVLISGTTTIAFSSASALTGTGVLAATSAAVFNETGALTGAGSLAGTTTATFNQSATISGGSGTAGTTAIAFAGTATILAAGALAGTTSATITPSATLRGLVSVVGNATMAFVATSTIGATGVLTGTQSVAVSATSTLLGAGALVGTVTTTFSAQADATFSDGTRHIVGSTAISVATTSTLAGHGALQGASGFALSGSCVVHGVQAVRGNVNFRINGRATISHFGQAEQEGAAHSFVQLMHNGTSYVSIVE